MRRTEFLKEMASILEKEPGSLKGDEVLSTLDAWDSLAVVGFIAMMDSKFGVVVSPFKINACKTIIDLAGLSGSALED